MESAANLLPFIRAPDPLPAPKLPVTALQPARFSPVSLARQLGSGGGRARSPRRSAAPDRRPIDRSSQPHPVGRTGGRPPKLTDDATRGRQGDAGQSRHRRDPNRAPPRCLSSNALSVHPRRTNPEYPGRLRTVTLCQLTGCPRSVSVPAEVGT